MSIEVNVIFLLSNGDYKHCVIYCPLIIVGIILLKRISLTNSLPIVYVVIEEFS